MLKEMHYADCNGNQFYVLVCTARMCTATAHAPLLLYIELFLGCFFCSTFLLLCLCSVPGGATGPSLQVRESGESGAFFTFFWAEYTVSAVRFCPNSKNVTVAV